MKKIWCLLACLLLALCCYGAAAEDDNVCWCEDWGDATIQYDENGHWMVCGNCGKIPYENQGPHELWCDNPSQCGVCGATCSTGVVWHYNDSRVVYLTDATSHWYVCPECGETTEAEEHWVGCWNEDNTHCLTCRAECEPNHSWAVSSETEATCTTAGATVYTCGNCDGTKTENVDALGHEWEVVTIWRSTCANCGTVCDHSNIDYAAEYEYDEERHWKYCLDCGAEAPDVSFSHGNACTQRDTCWACNAPYDSGYYPHYEADAVYITDETSHWFVCSDCGETTEPEAHWNNCDWGETTCQDCGYATGPLHEWKVTGTTEPTCSEEGVTEYVCRYCPDVTKTESIDMVDHEWEVVDEWSSVCANCGAVCEHHNLDLDIGYGYNAEEHWMYCADCGAVSPDASGYHGNSCDSTDKCWACEAPFDSGYYPHYDVDAVYYTDETSHWFDCPACGETTEPEEHRNYCDMGDTTCRVCGYATGPLHEWKVTGTTEPTCTEDGVTEYVCRYCPDVTKTEADIPATGHTFEDGGKTDPTCTEDGYQQGVCIACGETLDEPIPATGHSFEETERVPSGCKQRGSVTYVCSACGETKVETLAANGHVWSNPTTQIKPTCTENGRTVRTCANCDVLNYETLEATGHSMVAQENGDQVCSACGYTEAAPVTEEPAAEEPVVEEPVVEEIVVNESEPVEAVVVEAAIETQPDAEPIGDVVDLVVYEPLEELPVIPETIKESVETVYVVYLLDEGESVQPSGILRLRILLAEDADLTGQVLMLVNADGTMVELEYQVADGYLVFETEVTGVFVLVNAAE